MVSDAHCRPTASQTTNDLGVRSINRLPRRSCQVGRNDFCALGALTVAERNAGNVGALIAASGLPGKTRRRCDGVSSLGFFGVSDASLDGPRSQALGCGGLVASRATVQKTVACDSLASFSKSSSAKYAKSGGFVVDARKIAVKLGEAKNGASEELGLPSSSAATGPAEVSADAWEYQVVFGRMPGVAG